MTKNKIVFNNAISSKACKVSEGSAGESSAPETVASEASQSDAEGADVSSLVVYGKLQAVSDEVNSNEVSDKEDDTELLQREVKRILWSKLPPDERENNGILKCCTVPKTDKPRWWASYRLDASCKNMMRVWYEDFYCHCKSIWVCPRDAPLIAFGRRFQIRALIYTAKHDDDKECYMLTLTTKHDAFMSLDDLLERLGGANVRLWQDFVIKKLFGSHFVGRVTVCEIMYGRNGWHPHFHILLIGEKGLDIKHLSDLFTEKWLDMLEKEGLEGLEGVACDFEACKDIKDYLTKIPCEICGVSKKDGKFPKHLNFFQLVSKCVQTPYGQRKRKLEDLIFEYYKATKNRHFIFFSKGLKERYGVENETEDAFMDRMQGLGKSWRRLGLGFCFDSGYENLTASEVHWCLRVLDGYEKGKDDRDVEQFLKSKGVQFHMEDARDADGLTGSSEDIAWIKEIRSRHKNKNRKGEAVRYIPKA